jgi:hypothetical protein
MSYPSAEQVAQEALYRAYAEKIEAQRKIEQERIRREIERQKEREREVPSTNTGTTSNSTIEDLQINVDAFNSLNGGVIGKYLPGDPPDVPPHILPYINQLMENREVLRNNINRLNVDISEGIQNDSFRIDTAITELQRASIFIGEMIGKISPEDDINNYPPGIQPYIRELFRVKESIEISSKAIAEIAVSNIKLHATELVQLEKTAFSAGMSINSISSL